MTNSKLVQNGVCIASELWTKGGDVRIEINYDLLAGRIPYTRATGLQLRKWLQTIGVDVEATLLIYGVRSVKDLIFRKIIGTCFYAPLK